MRKIVIGAALLLGAALLTTGTPAQAAVGCLCGKIGAPAVCVPTITHCNFHNGGVCVLPCVLEEPKMGMKHMRHHKMGMKHMHHHKMGKKHMHHHKKSKMKM